MSGTLRGAFFEVSACIMGFTLVRRCFDQGAVPACVFILLMYNV